MSSSDVFLGVVFVYSWTAQTKTSLLVRGCSKTSRLQKGRRGWGGSLRRSQIDRVTRYMTLSRSVDVGYEFLGFGEDDWRWLCRQTNFRSCWQVSSSRRGSNMYRPPLACATLVWAKCVRQAEQLRWATWELGQPHCQRKLVEAACMRCNGTKCPLFTAFFSSSFCFTYFSPRRGY